jgi:hypothetical protein
MSRVLIFLPISRSDYLDRIFSVLETLQCDAADTTLLAYVDSANSRLYGQARRLVEASKFAAPRCIQRPGDHGPTPYSVSDRRRRIAAVHNEVKALVSESEFVFGIEDDTLVPANALERLLMDYAAYPYAGFIQGVELGRWGFPYVGAWQADDVYEPSRVESTLPPEEATVQAIDAGGFYCYLTPTGQFVAHDYDSFEDGLLGPDVNYGIWLRKQGFQNYIDWSIPCLHYQRGADPISLHNRTPRQVILIKEVDRWRQKIA